MSCCLQRRSSFYFVEENQRIMARGKNLMKYLLWALVAVLLLFMLLPSILVKVVSPDKLFNPPSTEEVGELPPLELSLLDLVTGDSTVLRTADLEGLQVLYFWTEACQPCPSEMENLVRLKNEMGDDLNVWAVSIDKAQDRAGRYATLHPQPFPLFYRTKGDLPEGLSRGKAPQSWLVINPDKAYRQMVPVNWSSPEFMEWLKSQ